MRRFLPYLLILLSLPAFAQIGRYKSIPTGHYNYTLKLDTATGAVWSVKFDSAKNATVEKKILEEKFKDYKAGRFDLITTDTKDHYLLLDSSTGKYTILDWQPEPPKEPRGTNKPPRDNGDIEVPAEVMPVLDPRAAFPEISSRDTISRNSGDDSVPGNASVDGTTDGGANAHISGWRVSKRVPMKAIPSGKQGTVVVDIWINENGRVIDAKVNSAKSTTIDHELIKAALDAARGFEFTPVSGQEPKRTGSVVCHFKMQ